VPERRCTFDESDGTVKGRAGERRHRDFRPSVEMRNPIPTIGVPKNSATIAPISASVELIFKPLKMNGSAAGSRSFASVCQ
jgi:hypothetical protein